MMILGKTLEDWTASHPLIRELVELKETSWFNPATAPTAQALGDVGLTAADVADASARLSRFAPYIMRAFPETAAYLARLEARPSFARVLRDAEPYAHFFPQEPA